MTTNKQHSAGFNRQFTAGAASWLIYYVHKIHSTKQS